MDESFNVRVDKVFGSLAPQSRSSSSLRSLWSLSDQEVEKKEWNRERENPDRDENPCSSTFDGFFSNQRKFISERNSRTRLDDEDEDYGGNDEEDEQRGPKSSTQYLDEEWDIKSSIGLDCTLDNEEEEDEHDKVALGKENSGDRLYMKEITDYGPFLNSHNILPESFKDHARDSRANHMAARIRLKEDEEASETFAPCPDAGNKMTAAMDSPLTEDSLKSILKRKENQIDNKSQKRVRFDPACKDKCEEELECGEDSVMVNYPMETNTGAIDTTSLSAQNTPRVPDYVQNPSKYTRYTFESSSEVDEKTNQQAYMDFLNMVKSSRGVDSQLEVPSSGLPESVTFIPKKKAAAAAAADTTLVKDMSNMKQPKKDASKECIHRVGFVPGIAAAEIHENEACAMDEDEADPSVEFKCGSSHKTGRKYRSKVQPDDSVVS